MTSPTPDGRRRSLDDASGRGQDRTSLWHRLWPAPKDWGLRDNEDQFVAQLLPNSKGIVDALAHAVELAPGEVATKGRPGMVVKVRGEVQYGPGGPVVAPLSQNSCAWYRSYVSTVRHSLPIVGGSGMQPVPDVAPPDINAWRHGGTAFRKALRPHAEISTEPFRIGDESGHLDIDPYAVAVNTDLFAANHTEHPNRLDDCLLLEWFLPRGAHVFLLGTLGPDLRLVPGRDPVQFISTNSEQHVLGRHRTAVSRQVLHEGLPWHRRETDPHLTHVPPRHRVLDGFAKAAFWFRNAMFVLGALAVIAAVVFAVVASS